MEICPKIALVIPCYNEQEVLPETASRLLTLFTGMMSKRTISNESKIYFVNDGSRDNTWALIEELSAKEAIFAGLKLSRNRGHQNALIAGLMELYPDFDALISLDADLQDDLAVIEQFVESFKQGNDIVYGVRSERKTDNFFKKASAEYFYRLISAMGVEIIFNHADYRLMSKRALEALSQYRETNLFLRAIIPQLGYPSAIIYYSRHERFSGESKYPLKKMIEFALQGITSFSSKPLSIIRNVGLGILVLSFLMAIYTFISYFQGNIEKGWSSIFLSIWFLGGFIITALGVVGEYIGKIYQEVKARPRYFIEKRVG